MNQKLHDFMQVLQGYTNTYAESEEEEKLLVVMTLTTHFFDIFGDDTTQF